MNDDCKTFLVSYGLGNALYCLELKASDWADAERHLAALKAWGRVDGELKLKIPVRSRWLERLAAWWAARAKGIAG